MKISTFIQIYDNRIWNALTKEFLDLTSSEIEFIKYYKDKQISNDVPLPNNLLRQNIIITEENEKQLINNLKQLTRDKQIQSLFNIFYCL